jgi:hypothetical protein
MSIKSFGGLKSCKNQKVVHTGSAFVTQETGAGGLTSPQVSGVVIRPLSIPAQAAEVYVMATEDLRIGIDIAFVRGYAKIPKNQWHGFGVTDMDTIYYSRDTIDGTLYFYFVIV